MEESNNVFQIPASTERIIALESDPGSLRRRRLLRIHQQAIQDVSQWQRSWLKRRYVTSDRVPKKSIPNSSKSSWMNVPRPNVQISSLDRLHQLRRHRLALAAQLELNKVVACRNKSLDSTIAYVPEMLERLRKISFPIVDGDVGNNEESMKALLDSVHQNQGLDQLRQLRLNHCLQAANRLTGFSVVPDSKRFILRFDVGKNCYHCIFDLVLVVDATVQPLMDDSGVRSVNCDRTNAILCLRLLQHTLPASIPIQAILQRTTTLDCKSMIRLGPWLEFVPEPDAATITTSLLWSKLAEKGDIMKQLQNMSVKTYHACHCLLIRRETWDFLNSCITSTTSLDDNNNSMKSYSLHHLECPDKNSFQTIRFHVNHRLSSIADIRIVLHYSTDLCRPKAHHPSSVKIKVSKEISPFHSSDRVAPTRSTLDAVVSDIEDRDSDHIDHCEFIENAVLSFRRLPIQKAIDAVTDAMAEY